MKINIAKPSAGTQKSLEIDDDFKCSALNGKRLGQEFDGGIISDQLKGHIFKITGGNDKQGFPMKQGVLVAKRVRLLLSKGLSCYRPRRTGERKRKSVRGCIIGADISALSLVLVKQGSEPIPGLTDCEVPCRLGPKRASKIRKLYNLSRNDDVTRYVTRREVIPRALTADDVPQEVKDKKKPYTKAPKIQRLITPVRLQRKRRIHAQKIKGIQASREKAAKYAVILAQRIKERKMKRKELHTKRRAGNSAENA